MITVAAAAQEKGGAKKDSWRNKALFFRVLACSARRTVYSTRLDEEHSSFDAVR